MPSPLHQSTPAILVLVIKIRRQILSGTANIMICRASSARPSQSPPFVPGGQADFPAFFEKCYDRDFPAAGRIQV